MRSAITVGIAIALGATAAQAGSAEKSKMRTIEATADRVAVGAAVFRICEPCHGDQGDDKPAIAASLTSKTFLEAVSDDFLVEVIEKGRPGTAMVSWKGVLTRDQIEGIVAHLRTKTPTEPVKLDESPMRGDANRGLAIFKERCSVCHAGSGSGLEYHQWGTHITGPAFLAQVSNGYLRHIIKNGKSGTAMKAFKGDSPLPELNLTPDQVEDAVAWLRSGKHSP